MNFDILYRGYLSSCNYTCSYCPFVKQHDDKLAREKDSRALKRFVNWLKHRNQDCIGVLFTPWGEALIRRSYREAFVELSHMRHIRRVAAQTNLSGSLTWLERGNSDKIALWATFHPEQISQTQFLRNCRYLDSLNICYSVGIVGLKENKQAAHNLRAALRENIYLWVNAPPDSTSYYNDNDVAYFENIDPLFGFNWRSHLSAGKDCYSGERVISVKGDGSITRCHFDNNPLGNIYLDNLKELLKPRVCVQTSCDCHIGYSHLKELNFNEIFGNGILERIPRGYSSQ